MRPLQDFLEAMDHEFADLPLRLEVLALKVDGEGIKKHCQLHALKSVDYIYPRGDGFPLVEFSDIARQQHRILNDIAGIKASNLAKALRTDLIKARHKAVNQELVAKYKDTLTIISRLNQHCADVPEDLLNGLHHYYVVVAPLHEEIAAPGRRIEIIRFLDNLESKIINSMPEQLFAGVSVVLIHAFAEQHL
ncbi:hypothetical protein [Methylovulum psychrotolerans]|uniref:Uncharacterized protein n=1 Tax=Methylovulum psychrotolerans TaxID=1704499 RepID=A0A1Z4C2Z3_9GAMM|nr:hypothetical protein [Methylovulum psychrotolerans]ASF47917.1 hypothetical protein CEK71_18615 [Methylovulum psychrotolerans]